MRHFYRWRCWPARRRRRSRDAWITRRAQAGGVLARRTLSEVAPPTESQEATRALVRQRSACVQALGRARHRLSKFLPRRHLTHCGKNWTAKHLAWLHTLKLEDATDPVVLRDLLGEVEHQLQRKGQLTKALQEVAMPARYATRATAGSLPADGGRNLFHSRRSRASRGGRLRHDPEQPATAPMWQAAPAAERTKVDRGSSRRKTVICALRWGNPA